MLPAQKDSLTTSMDIQDKRIDSLNRSIVKAMQANDSIYIRACMQLSYDRVFSIPTNRKRYQSCDSVSRTPLSTHAPRVLE